MGSIIKVFEIQFEHRGVVRFIRCAGADEYHAKRKCWDKYPGASIKGIELIPKENWEIFGIRRN